MAHKADDGGERKLPEYSWDYCFPGDELECKLMVLVGRDRDTGTIMATNYSGEGRYGVFR